MLTTYTQIVGDMGKCIINVDLPPFPWTSLLTHIWFRKFLIMLPHLGS